MIIELMFSGDCRFPVPGGWSTVCFVKRIVMFQIRSVALVAALLAPMTGVEAGAAPSAKDVVSHYADIAEAGYTDALTTARKS